MAGYADVVGSADVANDVARTDVVAADVDALTWLGSLFYQLLFPSPLSP